MIGIIVKSATGDNNFFEIIVNDTFSNRDDLFGKFFKNGNFLHIGNDKIYKDDKRTILEIVQLNNSVYFKENKDLIKVFFYTFFSCFFEDFPKSTSLKEFKEKIKESEKCENKNFSIDNVYTNGKKWEVSESLADFVGDIKFPVLTYLENKKEKLGVLIDESVFGFSETKVLFIDKDSTLENNLFNSYYRNGKFLSLFINGGIKKLARDDKKKVLDLLKEGEGFLWSAYSSSNNILGRVNSENKNVINSSYDHEYNSSSDSSSTKISKKSEFHDGNHNSDKDNAPLHSKIDDQTLLPNSSGDKDKKNRNFSIWKNSSTVKKFAFIGIGFSLLISIVAAGLYFFGKYKKILKKKQKKRGKSLPLRRK